MCHLDFNPPLVPGVDVVTGELLVQQEDDKPEAAAPRIGQYKDVQSPLELHKNGGVLHQFSEWRLTTSGPRFTCFSQTRSALFSPKKHAELAPWKDQEDAVGCSFNCMCSVVPCPS